MGRLTSEALMKFQSFDTFKDLMPMHESTLRICGES